MSEVNLTPASAAEVDKNMVAGAPDAAGLVWHSVKEAPFEIYGLYEPAADGDFRRMPDDVAAATNNGVSKVSSLYCPMNLASFLIILCNFSFPKNKS